MDRSLIIQLLMIDHMSPDYESVMKSEWKVEFMEGSTDDLKMAYISVGAVKECGQSECHYAPGGNQCMKSESVQPDRY